MLWFRGRAVTGFAIAILKLVAVANLLVGVGLALGISLSGYSFGPPGPFADFTRIAIELFCAFEGFMGWALCLVVASTAERVEQLSEQLREQLRDQLEAGEATTSP